VRIGGHAGRAIRGDRRRGDGRRGEGRRAWRARAFLTAAALTAVTFTAGCAALGTSAAGGQAPVTARATATGSSGPAAAAPSATSRPSSHPHKTTATPSRASSVMPARTGPVAGGTLTPTAPAAPGPPPSGVAGQPTGDQRRVTFVNQMAQTIWVAAAPNANTPLAATGWVLPAGQSVTITTPNNLNARFWGRTGCVFSSAGVGHCETGDCGGRFQCNGWGTIPATLAEVNFDAWDNLDFYDVSMVDGSNLPMFINITKSSGGTKDKISPNGCVAAGCTKPVTCPSALAVKAGNAVVGCISACARLGGDQYCCRGQWSSRSACDPTKWPVDYAEVFKSAEPYAYSYVDDDATSVFTCSGVCDYRITFGLSH
jgi:Thaumatin family